MQDIIITFKKQDGTSKQFSETTNKEKDPGPGFGD